MPEAGRWGYVPPPSAEPISLRQPDLISAGIIQGSGLSWAINFAPLRPIPSSYLGPGRIQEIQNQLRDNSVVDYGAHVRSPKHTEVVRFFVDHWPTLIRLINNHLLVQPIDQSAPPFEERMFPEVFLRHPYFGAEAGHSLDCIGNDRSGALYVFEIGVGHDENKTGQLQKQLYLVRTLFPDASISGAVVKYKQIEEKTRRLFIRFV